MANAKDFGCTAISYEEIPTTEGRQTELSAYLHRLIDAFLASGDEAWLVRSDMTGTAFTPDSVKRYYTSFQNIVKAIPNNVATVSLRKRGNMLYLVRD